MPKTDYPLRVLISTDALHLAIMKSLAKDAGLSVSEMIRTLIMNIASDDLIEDATRSTQPNKTNHGGWK